MTEKTKKNVPSRNEVKFYADISKLIEASKRTVQHSINSSMVLLYWSIGQYLVSNVMENEKAEYGKSIVENLSRKLTLGYGRGFEKSALFRMVKFYREFPDQQKVATLSQQLTWSHFIELIPIENELKRNFYVAMCSNENWNVRT